MGDYVEGKDMIDILIAIDDGTMAPLPVQTQLKWISLSAKGLASMHSKQLAHLDVKPDNIMLGAKGEVKIVDLGCSMHKKMPIRHRVGTDGYTAPEILIGARNNFKNAKGEWI